MAVVLIVEDDEQVRMLAESILQDVGRDGLGRDRDGSARNHEKIDALFVDVTLPDHHEAGLELAEAAAKTRPGLPVIYTTGRGVTDGMLALFVQPNVFLAKPYNGEQLLTAVANVLKK